MKFRYKGGKILLHPLLIAALVFILFTPFFLFVDSDFILAQSLSPERLERTERIHRVYSFLNPIESKIDTRNNLIYVSNKIGITVLDANDYSVVNKIFIDRRFNDLYINETANKIYAITHSHNQLLIFDALNKEELKKKAPEELLKNTVILPTTSDPAKIFVNNEKKYLYVFAAIDSKIMIIDLDKASVEKNLRINTPLMNLSALMTVYSSKHDKIYLLNREGREIWAVDLKTSGVKRVNNTRGISHIEINDEKNELYAADIRSGALVIINTINDEISSIIPLLKLPSKVFYNKTLDKILLLSMQYDELMVIDSISQKVEKYIDLGAGADPINLVFNPGVNTLFVMNSGANNVSAISTDSWKIIKTLDTPPNPSATPEFNSLNGDVIIPFPWAHINALYIIKPDYTTMLVPPQIESLVEMPSFFQFPINFAVHPKKGYVYVVNNLGAGQDGGKSKITALDSRNDNVLWVTHAGSNALEIAVDSLRNKIYTNNADENTVSVINASNGKSLKSIPVGIKPRTLILDEKSGKLFVANSRSNSISIINTQIDEVEATININHREPHRLLYDPHNNFLYVGTTDNALVVIKINENDHKIIYDLKLPEPGGIILEPLVQSSSDLNKIYIITIDGGIYLAENGTLKTLKSSEPDMNWGDIIYDGQNEKIYISDSGKRVIYSFDIKTGDFRTLIRLNFVPSQMVLANADIYVFTEEGTLEIINSQTGAIKNSVALSSILPSLSSTFPSVSFPREAIFEPENKKIYTVYPGNNTIISFDVIGNKITNVLRNESAHFAKAYLLGLRPVYLYLILIISLSIISIFLYLFLKTRKKLIISQSEESKDNHEA